MTERDITYLLWSNYGVKNKYFCKNRFIFWGGGKVGSWESDSFMMSRSRLCTDYEVKIVYQDFLKEEEKKDKHKFLLETYEAKGENLKGKRTAPNYFIFVMPEGMESEEEVVHRFPYASLKVITPGGAILTKIRKKLHPVKLDMRDTLLDKFYYENLTLNKIISQNYKKYKAGRLDIGKMFKQLRIK